MNKAVFHFIVRQSVATKSQGFKTKILQIMKRRMFIIGVLILSSLVGARAQDKCPNVIVIRKTLYDSFQNTRGTKESLERQLIRNREILDDLRKKYEDCEHQADIGAMLKQAGDDVTSVEARLKEATEAYNKVAHMVQQIMDDAHDVAVVYRYYDSGYGSLGRVWTMTFSDQGDKIVIVPSYYDLPDHAVGRN